MLADDIVVIDRGRRDRATGTPDELKAQTGGQVLRAAAGARPGTWSVRVRWWHVDSRSAHAIEGSRSPPPVDGPAADARPWSARSTSAGIAVGELTLRRA